MQNRGFESKHNLHCWEQREYLGFGLAAHSYYQKQRYGNVENLEQYIENIKNNQLEKNRILYETQDEQGEQKEYMLLGLRKLQGVSIQDFQKKFGNNPLVLYQNSLGKETIEEIQGIEKIQENIKEIRFSKYCVAGICMNWCPTYP